MKQKKLQNEHNLKMPIMMKITIILQQNKHNLKEDKQTLSEKAVDDEKSKTEVVENTNSEDDIFKAK